MSAAGVTTHYAMSGDYPLSADASGNTTFYLYGLGPIAEKTNAWNYGLPDGTNTQRQLTDANGEITFTARYTPWGDTLETYGDGGFTFGYFGGLMDAATGLLYVGNGQYYDPETGRFLTRDAKPNQSNPYVPWNNGNPSGLLIGPIALLGVLYTLRRKRNKWDTLLICLVIGSALALSLTACGPGTTTPLPPAATATPTETPPPVPPGEEQNQGDGTDSGDATPTPTAPSDVDLPECAEVPPSWLPDKVIFTRYVTVREDDVFFAPNDSFCVPGSMACGVPFETVPGGEETTYQEPPVWHFYIGNSGNPTWSVYWNGSGILTTSASLSMSGGKGYVQADTNNRPTYYGHTFGASYYFTDKVRGTCGNELNANENIIAVASNLYGTDGHSCGDTYYINLPGLENTIFTVKDTGTFTVEGNQPDHFDLYVGIQDHNSFVTSPLAQYDGQLVQIARVQPS